MINIIIIGDGGGGGGASLWASLFAERQEGSNQGGPGRREL